MPETRYSAEVLRNHGAPVVVHKLDAGGAIQHNADGSPVTETLYVRFDMNALADLELRFNGVEGPEGADLTDLPETAWGPVRRFYGLSAWQVATRLTPFVAVRAGLALGLSCEEEVAGRLMIPGEGLQPYISGVMAAFAVANGEDPSQVAESTNRALDSAAAARAARLAPANESPSPSTDGSPDGSVEASTPATSGS